MKKLVNLALTVGAVAGTVYYLQQKGILSFNTSEKEDGSRTIEVKVDLPKKPELTETEEDVVEAAQDVTEAAEDLAEALGSSAMDAMDELSRDIDSMLESIRENPEGQF